MKTARCRAKGSCRPGVDPVQIGRTLLDRGVRFSIRGRPDLAKRHLQRALSAFMSCSAPRTLDVANVLVEFADATHACGDYASSSAHARRALAVLKSTNGDQDIERLRARAYALIGSCRVASGDYRLAETAWLRAVAIAKAGLPAEDLAIHVNGLAIVYKYTARFADAERLYEQSLRVMRRRDGARSLAVAAILHNMAGLDHAQGKLARGEARARRGLEIRRAALGAEHPDVAADAAGLAVLLMGRKKFTEAERLLHDAIGVFQRSFGKEHAEVGFIVGNLAVLHHACGRAPEANRMYRRALRMKIRALGVRHPDVALTLQNMASLQHSLNRTQEARTLARRACAIFRKRLGARHPHTRSCVTLLRSIDARARGERHRAR